MALKQSARDPYLRTGVAAMLGAAVVYATIEDPLAATTGLFAALFAAGAAVAVGSPTRWSVRTTLWLYRSVPLVVGVGALAAGGFGALATAELLLSGVLLGWGVVALVSFAVGPWSAVETHLRDLRDREERGPAPPLPEEHMGRLRYAAVGLLVATTAVVAVRLIVRPDPGHVSVLSGVAAAGLVHARCSGHDGSVDRVVLLRRARWALMAAGAAGGSLYGALVSGTTLSATALGTVALGLAYWSTIGGPWETAREEIAAAREERV